VNEASVYNGRKQSPYPIAATTQKLTFGAPFPLLKFRHLFIFAMR
jgi:hypothetical protein